MAIISSDKEGLKNYIVDSYIMSCLKKYEAENPLVPKNDDNCKYCSGQENITDIPFGTKICISGNRMIIEMDNELLGVNINYCPICGKKIEI